MDKPSTASEGRVWLTDRIAFVSASLQIEWYKCEGITEINNERRHYIA